MSNAPDNAAHPWRQIAPAFLKLGALSYGGPAIMGIMQTEIQEKRGWLAKDRFLEGLSLVNMLPGPGATQLAIYIGYQLAGWRGGVVAGACFILPAFFIMLALTLLYSAFGALPVMRDAFYGLGPVVLGIFLVAVYRLGKAALQDRRQLAIAIAAALLVAFTPVGIAGTLLLAGCVGIALYHARAPGLRALFVVAIIIGAFHWWSVMMATAGQTSAGIAAGAAVPPGLAGLGAFFFKVGAFTFGGGITMLAFVQEQVVNQLHWLTPREFLDGLALGQLTPGPILMLAAYVGYKLDGIVGAMVGGGAIFLPSFVVMLAVLPALQRFRGMRWIKAAMKAIGAAVIGAIGVSLLQMAPHAIPDAFAAFLMLLTVVAMLVWRWGPALLVPGGGLLGVASRSGAVQRAREFF